MSKLPSILASAVLASAALVGSACSSSGSSDDNAGSGAGGGSPQPNCGDLVCAADQVCWSCLSDDMSEGTLYTCAPAPPTPGPGEFLCHDRLCAVGQYCEQKDDDLCSGNIFASCHDSPPECAGSLPDCACLEGVVCFLSCESDGDGNVTVYTSTVIDCG